MRAKKPIVIIDAYYDGDGQALCPAATGHQPSHQPVGRHRAVPDRAVRQGINPHDRNSLYDKFMRSEFLRDFRETGRRSDARLHRAGAAGPDQGIGREARSAATRRSAIPRWPSWTRCSRAPRSTIRATRSRRRAGRTGSPRGTGSMISGRTTKRNSNHEIRNSIEIRMINVRISSN